MALPQIAIVSTGGTIQNSQPFVTSAKAGGSVDVLRPQKLYEPVVVKIAREDIDGNPLPVGPGEEPYRTATLGPGDGLYMLPYMEPGYEPPVGYGPARISVDRLAEEIDRFGLDTTGRNNLIRDTAELVANLVIDPETGQELRAGGETFTMRELVLIANTVNKALAGDNITGCVLTHGTVTVEETACFLNYTVASDKPVAICSSQRRHTSVGNDGDWNLIDAVRVAICPEAKGKGVILVMNESILPAREVTKTNQRPDGFVSSGGAAMALGSVESDQVTFYFDPVRRHTYKSQVRPDAQLPLVLPRVDIVKTYVGADGAPIEALVERAAREKASPAGPQKHGILLEGFAPSGMPHHYQTPAMENAVYRHGIPIALANRGDHGRIARSSGAPFITCDNLMAVKARLLLTLAIEKLGMLTPCSNPDSPTTAEKEKLAGEIGRFQEIFDTH